MESFEAYADMSGMKVYTGQMSTGVEILLTMSHNILTTVKEYVK